LVIRSFEESDLPEFEKLLMMPEVPGWYLQRERAADFLRWHIANYEAMDIIHGIVCFGIFDPATGQVLGAVGAGEHDDLHETEIGINLLPSARGNGYAVEATVALTSWVFANATLPYLIATVAIENLPSRRAIERCGYQLIDERLLLVHVTGEQHHFRYYRLYRN